MSDRAGDTLLEIQVFKVAPERRATFHAAMEMDAIPCLEAHGLTIVGYGPSQHDEASYFLLRCYPSLEYRAQALASCEQSPDWRRIYDTELAPLLLDQSLAVMPCEPAGIEALKHTLFH